MERTPHEIAYMERCAYVRRDYVGSLLEAPAPYTPELYRRCQKYVDCHRSNYAAHKRMITYEMKCESHWGSLTFKEQLHVLLEYPSLTVAGTCISIVGVMLVLASTVFMILESEVSFNPRIHGKYVGLFSGFEVFFTIAFSIETGLQLYAHPHRIELLHSISFISDFISCLPLPLSVFIATFAPNVVDTTDPFRMLRLFRFMRYLRGSREMRVMFSALKEGFLVVGGSLIFLVFFAVLMASVMYYSERGQWNAAHGRYEVPACNCEAQALHAIDPIAANCTSQPSTFSLGIPSAIWWSLGTVLTVGFGDYVSQCSVPKVVATFGIVAASLFLAMPIAVLGNRFAEKIEEDKAESSQERKLHAQHLSDLHQKTLQIIVARRLREVRVEKLMMLCERYNLPKGTAPQMRCALYEFFGLGSDADNEAADGERIPPELPVVMSPGEALIDYIRHRYPFDSVNLESAPSQVVDIIDNFFDRVYAALMRTSSSHLSARLEALHEGAFQKIIPLVRRPIYSVGIDVPGLTPPDIVLPVSEFLPATALAPRMAYIQVVAQFGKSVYVLCPHGHFRPMICHEAVPPCGAVLQDGDVINFGDEASPIAFTFSVRDEFAASGTARVIEDELATKLWLAKQEKVHSSRLTPVRSLSPPSRPAVSSKDLQFYL